MKKIAGEHGQGSGRGCRAEAHPSSVPDGAGGAQDQEQEVHQDNAGQGAQPGVCVCVLVSFVEVKACLRMLYVVFDPAGRFIYVQSFVELRTCLLYAVYGLFRHVNFYPGVFSTLEKIFFVRTVESVEEPR